MFKKLMIIPLGVTVLILSLLSLKLVCPVKIPLLWQIAITLFLLFPVPLLPAAAMMPRGRARTLVHRVGEAVMGGYLYLLILLVIDAAICLFSYFSGLFTVNLPLMGILSLLSWLLILLFGGLNARRIKTVKKEIRLSKDKGAHVRAVLISDLHLGFFSTSAFIKRTVDAINAAQPAYLFIAGDLLDSDLSELSPKKNAESLLKSVNAPCGVFACMGNHDLYAAPDPAFPLFYRRAGIRLLHDERVELDPFLLVGRSEVHEKERIPLETLLEKSEKPTVVLCHNPKDGERLIDAGADLVLCGHTHNGQTFPGNIASKLKSRYSYGYNRYKTGAVLTTAGVGYWGIPLRVFTANEIVVLDLYF